MLQNFTKNEVLFKFIEQTIIDNKKYNNTNSHDKKQLVKSYKLKWILSFKKFKLRRRKLLMLKL